MTLEGFDVTIYTEVPKSERELIDRLKGKEGVVLIKKRTEINDKLLLQLPHLKIISQTGKISNHLDL